LGSLPKPPECRWLSWPSPFSPSYADTKRSCKRSGLLLASLQKGNQIRQLACRQLLIQSRRHDGDFARLNLVDIVAGNGHFLIQAEREDEFGRRFFADEAVVYLVVLGRDEDRLVTANQTGAGEDDRFE